MMEVETLICPSCERVWPVISEQGIYVEFFGMCHHCTTRQVITERDKLRKTVDYVIINCYDCAAQNPAMSTCITCAGYGWVASEDE